MTRMLRFVPRADTVFYSKILKHTISALTTHAAVTLDFGGRNITFGTVTSIDPREKEVLRRLEFGSYPGEMTDFSAVPLAHDDVEWLDSYAQTSNSSWQAFLCEFRDGVTDRISIRLNGDKTHAQIQGFLSTIWPVLREDCLNEARHNVTESGDDALMWMISDRIDVGVMVMDAQGLVLKLNAAAKSLLKNGNVLRRSRRGICGVDEQQTHLLREAVLTCAAVESGVFETVLFLETSTPGRRSPVILSHFMHKGEPTGLVTVLLPAPPEPKRIEMLAKKMGLTQAEARVAALLQTGLSNREAAKMAGLKEQSFSTYAKRALSKLNVRSRAEMAQLLTWQAQGGGISSIRKMKGAET